MFFIIKDKKLIKIVYVCLSHYTMLPGSSKLKIQKSLKKLFVYDFWYTIFGVILSFVFRRILLSPYLHTYFQLRLDSH
jgi:hypothetical protein